jgi:hypothetical protein
MSSCLPTTTITACKKVYASSITHSIRSTNSTSPLPSSKKQQQHQQQPTVKQTHKQQLSRDVTTLYELFSNVTTTASHNSTHSNNYYENSNIVCLCCEKEITKRRNMSITTMDSQEEDRKRKIEDITSNITSALYYGSHQVRKYMKKVMTRDNWNHILKQGFPCPHKEVICWLEKTNSHYFCTLCDTKEQHATLRLTLTPSSCRAQDNEIYGEYHYLQTLALNDKQKKCSRKEGEKLQL